MMRAVVLALVLVVCTPAAAPREAAIGQRSAAITDTQPETVPRAGDETRGVTISFSGDILIHRSLWETAWHDGRFNFGPQFAAIREHLDGNVDICHLETPLTDGKPSTWPRFATPVDLADALVATGFEGCSAASNHSLDRGLDGVRTTRDAMHTAGVPVSGLRGHATDDAVVYHRTADGIVVAHLSYTETTNGISLPENAPWAVNLLDPDRILADAAAAARNADLVVVSLHWGVEYSQQTTSAQQRLADKLTASPHIDAIVGHHSHVLQRAELVNGKPVLYGLGNLHSGQGPWSGHQRGDIGTIVALTFTIRGETATFTGGTYQPTVSLLRGGVHPADTAPSRERCRAANRINRELLGTFLHPARALTCR